MDNIYEKIAQLSSDGLWDEVFCTVKDGLRHNYRDYELYFALGEYYLNHMNNINQAYLCYENALYYCQDDNDTAYIAGVMNEIIELGVSVKPVSIVIVSYNSIDIMKLCLSGIRDNNNSDTYELVVVDNASTDGVAEWLQSQNDIVYIRNKDNKGFGFACNQGIKAAAPDNDIFLLNNDTYVTPNAIFWLRMGLYENERIGATGCDSNFASGQMISEKYSTLQEYIEYGIRNNIPDVNPYEKKVWLSGFAMMIRRNALDNVGLLDLRYGMGYYEDDDLGIRLQTAGYHCVLCHNSFIFHWGSLSFKEKGDMSGELVCTNRNIFKDKWGFNIDYYSHPRTDIIQFISEARDKAIRVLEVGCGCGATLFRIKYMWPHADVKGIEIVDKIAEIGANNCDIIQGNIESMELPYEKEYFDYIIFGDVLEHLFEPDKVLKKIKPYMKKDASLLVSIPNIMSATVIVPLLCGNFQYEDSGILDRTHVKFYTLYTIIKLLDECGYKTETYRKVCHNDLGINIKKEYMEALYNVLDSISGSADREQFDVYQYILKASVTD